MIQTQSLGPVLRVVTGGMGNWTSQAYWVDGLLIDAGCGHGLRGFASALDGRSVEQVVLTHHHLDHVAAAGRLGPVPQIHPIGVPILEKGLNLSLSERVLWGTPPSVRALPLGNAVITTHHRFDVYHAPGHTDDHVILHERQQGWLFSGDLLIHPQVPILRTGEDLPGIIASLRLAINLPVEQVFCGHFRGTEPRRLQSRLSFLESVVDKAAGLARKGMPVKEIRTRLLGPENYLAFFTRGRFSKLNLIRAALDLAGVPEPV